MTTTKLNIPSAMKNSDEFPGTSINDVFPNEILGKILSKLNCQSDLLQARLVCHRWRLILDELVGYTMVVTSFYPVVRLLPFEDIRNILPNNLKSINVIQDPTNNMSTRHLTIGVPGMLINDGLAAAVERRITYLKDNTIIQILSPHVLKSLSCFEPICPNLVESLPPMTTLTVLNLSLFSLIGLDSTRKRNAPDSKIVLRSLKVLIISVTPAYAEFDSSTVSPQLSMLLNRLETPELVNVDITYPVVNLLSVNEDSTIPIMDFLGRTPKIRTLSVMVISPNQDFISPSKDFQYPVTVQEDMELLGKKLNLTTAKLKDNHLHSLRPSTHVKGWTTLFKQQRRLSLLEFNLKSSIDFEVDVMSVVRNNLETLKTLSLACFPFQILSNTQDINFVPIDASLLSDCCSLEALRIFDNLINTINLPTSLKRIYVDAMLTNKDSDDILLYFNGTLEQIELKDSRGGVPKGFGHGVSIQTLERFVGIRRTKRLVIYSGCLDGQYPEEGISNQDIIRPKRLHKRVLPPPNTMTPDEFERFLSETVRMDWTINKRGFYDDSNAEDEIICKMEETPEPTKNSEAVPPIIHRLFESSHLMNSFR